MYDEIFSKYYVSRHVIDIHIIYLMKVEINLPFLLSTVSTAINYLSGRLQSANPNWNCLKKSNKPPFLNHMLGMITWKTKN